jgi:DNA transformation protein and related proteins
MSDSHFIDHVMELLRGLDGISVRRMFGGYGVFRAGLMFGLVADDQLFLKVDKVNKPDFQEAGSSPFFYDRRDRSGVSQSIALSYWLLPPEVMDDPEMFYQWVIKACAAAARGKGKE